jgi:hypothetical protein
MIPNARKSARLLIGAAIHIGLGNNLTPLNCDPAAALDYA